MMNQQVLVGMAEIHAAKAGSVFTCLGLGSCIGLAAMDSISGIAAMAHIMLPEAFPNKPVEKPGKFASTAVDSLIDQMVALGANRRNLVMAYAGGAQVFKFGNDDSGRLDVGVRNTEAVAQIVSKLSLRVVCKDVGGNAGRTMVFHSNTGEITIRTVAGGERPLCSLR